MQSINERVLFMNWADERFLFKLFRSVGFVDFFVCYFIDDIFKAWTQIHCVFKTNQSIIDCFISKKGQLVNQKSKVKLSQMNWFILLIINMHRLFLVCLLTTIVTSCHYSCSTCTGPQYISCLTCPSNQLVLVVQNTSLTPPQYWASVYSTGACVSTTAPAANALGIIIFIFIIVICLFFQTKQTFYLLFTLQTYGLYNLVETAWVNPIGYVLQGLQYFMVMNTMGLNYKTQDYLLVASKNYRLDSFLGTTNLGQNLAIIAAFTIASLIILIVIAIIAIRKKKQAEKQQKQELIMGKQSGQLKQLHQKQQQIIKDDELKQNKGCLGCWRGFSEQVLIKIAKLLLCLLFLMAQQTCLVLLVSLVYQTPVNNVTIALCIIYLHILVFVMSYCYYYRVQYFKEKKAMYLAFAQKIVLPVMVVVPIKYQFIFFIFAIFFLILEFVFDYMNGLYRQFSRLLIYKGCQALSVLVLTIYYIVQNSAKTYSSSRAAAIAATFVLALNIFAFFGVQLPFAIKDKYFSNNVSQDHNQKQMEELNHNDTIDDLQGKNNNKVAEIAILNVQSNRQEQSNDGKKQDDATLDGNSIADHPKQPEIPHSIPTKIEPESVPEPQPQPQPNPKKRRKQIIDPELRMRYGI